MDSLLANYASSDEYEIEQQPPPVRRTAPPAKPEKLEGSSISGGGGGIFDSDPPAKSSLFNSLPPPSASQFSSLPPPKSSKPKKVVQFRPPTIAYAGRVDDDEDEDEDEDDDEEEEERQRKRSKAASLSTTSSASSLWSTLPAPKNTATLGALPSASGTGRRSMLETGTQASDSSSIATSEVVNAEDDKDQSSGVVYDYSNWTSGSENNAYYYSNEAYNQQSNDVSGEAYGYYGAYDAGSTAGDVSENPNPGSYEAADYAYGHDQNAGYTGYEAGYGDYGNNNAQYASNWANMSAVPEASGAIEDVLQVAGRRGRKDVPPEIIEVKQDELIKNRPREDQVKLTGIAFGPAYQPASSSKGKPTKLHKRKHQIGSLYFDMKQKETELAERRAQGFLTKAQTQAKYGW